MYHKIILVGNLGKDPEMRYTPTGQAVTSLNVATNRQYTGSDGQVVKETIWFRVSVWGKAAESTNQYLKKGSKVLVEGRLTPDKNTGNPRTYTRQDGTMGSSYDVSAFDVKFLSSRGEGGAAGETGGDDQFSSVPAAEEDIPF